jgi:hypothetical protein
MSKPEKSKVEDVLLNLEDKPPEKPSALSKAYNAASGVGSLAVNLTNFFAKAAQKAYDVYRIPAVNKTIYWPYEKDETSTGKAMAVGVLAVGVGAGFVTYGWGWTLLGSKLLASAAVAKGTQFGVAFGTKLIFNDSADDVERVVPQKKSAADADMGDLPEAPKVKATSRKADRNEM